MAGYYDPNKDYSKAISEAKAAGKDTSQLEAERQNKIKAKYGGKEPTMYGSNKTYSQASRDNDRDTIRNAISISNGRGSSKSASNGNRVTNLPGNAQPAQATPTPLAPAQLPALNQYGYRDMDYTTAIQNATSAAERTQLMQERANKIKYQYGGVEPVMTGSDKTYSQVYGSSSGSSGSSSSSNGVSSVYGVTDIGKATNYPTASNVGFSTNAMPDMSRRTDLAGSYATSGGFTVFYDENGYATKAVKGVVDYTPHLDINAGNGTYNSAGAWTDNEMLTAEDLQKIADIRAGIGTKYTGDQANQLANQIRSGYGYTIDKNGMVTDLGAMSAVDARRQAWGLPTNGVSAEMQNYLQLMEPEQQTTDPSALLASQYTLGNSKSGGNSNVGYGDAFQYIRDMYAANSASQLAALKAAYEQNVMDYNAQDDLISAEAQRQRNQAAAQNELQRMYMNELGIMQGLNTGATGQLALAQSAALQGNLASIGTQEQQALSDIALERSKLKVQYSAAVDQAIAQNNYELANALYQEYVRQDNLAQQKAAEDLEQQNWLAKFNYQKEQDALAQQNWQAQFDYQKQQDDLNYQLTLQKMYGANVGSTGSPVKTPSVGYNNGGLTNEQVKVLQNYYGVTADGLWGKNSTSAAGGMTAAQAWEQFTAPVTDVSQLSANGIAVANSLARGYTTGTQQRDAIISAYQNGRITRGEAEFLARAVGVSL